MDGTSFIRTSRLKICHRGFWRWKDFSRRRTVMNEREITDVAHLTLELALREPVIRGREEESVRSALAALKERKRDRARQLFEVTLFWNELQEFVHEWKESLNRQKVLTYIVDAWFLHDLIEHLTPGQDEEIAYVT